MVTMGGLNRPGLMELVRKGKKKKKKDAIKVNQYNPD